MNVDDWRLRATPAAKQSGDIGLGRRIVAWSPIGIVKASLHVQDDERGIRRQIVQGVLHESLAE